MLVDSIAGSSSLSLCARGLVLLRRRDRGDNLTAIVVIAGGRLMQSLEELKHALRAFAAERDWDQFHSAKNLAMAISIESAELMEHFQWAAEQQDLALDARRREMISDELADVLLYTVRLADKLGVDLLAAAAAKLVKNAERYPADKVRGQSRKYTEY